MGLFGLFISAQPLFGGEDPTVLDSEKENRHNWYHRKMTWEACEKADFSDAAAEAVSWHADSVDSYNYNPLFWGLGGLDRLKVALATIPHLENLHFDDLTSADQVAEVWDRLLCGTISGLLWTAETGRVEAAQNLLGASCHAVQDFYSHSNWIDNENRRARTYLSLSPAERYASPLYTGTYELPDAQGVKPHGKILLACSVLKQPSVAALRRLLCHAASPLAKSQLCEWWRACDDADAVQPTVLTDRDVGRLDVTIPDNTLYLAPKGMALDSKWQAVPAVDVRDIELSPIEAFDAAYDIALTATTQWLKVVGLFLYAHGGGRGQDLWRAIKTQGSSRKVWEQQFEDLGKTPYTFLTPGTYPPVGGKAGDWFVRLDVTTSRDRGSGTNADIYAGAEGQEFLLDHAPRKFPLVAYNDFKEGSTASYVIGPLWKCPEELTLRNDAASFTDVLESLGLAIRRKLDELADAIGDLVLSLIGGHADLVGSAKLVLDEKTLNSLDARGRTFTVRVNGRGEGIYDVVVRVSLRRELTTPAGAAREYQVQLNTLRCLKESEWDRGSPSDEPFVLALLLPFAPGDAQTWGSPVFSGVDDKNVRELKHKFAPVALPTSYGMMALSLTIMESDDETAKSRRDQLRDMVKQTDDVAELRDSVIATIGAAIEPDWKCEHIRCYVFNRGETLACGTVLDQRVNAWVRAEKRISLPLNTRALQRVEVRTPKAGHISLYTWWHPGRADHWSSADPARGGLGPVGSLLEGYRCIRHECLLLDPQRGQSPSNTLPVHTWWNPDRQDNFATTDRRWAGRRDEVRDGYRYTGVGGYLYDPARPRPNGTVAVHHWWSSDRKDNWLTCDPRWAGQRGDTRDGYRYVGTAGYGLSPAPQNLNHAYEPFI